MIHIILVSIIVIAFVCRKNQKLQNIAFVLLGLMASIRYVYGNDYRSYYRYYEQIKMGYKTPFTGEVLFTGLNKMTPSFYVLIIITSVFFIYVIYRFIVDNLEGKYAWAGLFVFLVNPYLFLMNLSAIRQCVAMCFFIIAVHFAIKKKNVAYVGCVIIASLFHNSAIILAPVLLLANDKKVDIKRILLVVLGVTFLLNFGDLILFIENFIRNIRIFNYSSYIGDGNGNTLRATILSAVYFVYILFNLPNLEGKYLIYGKMYLYSTILAILAYRVSMFTRLQMYFDIFSIIIVPYLMINRPMNGKIMIYIENPRKTIWDFCNRYILPGLIILIYFLRYYSFFTNPMWEKFFTYKTVIELL